MIDEARKHLIGKNVYIDTSYPPGLCFESQDWVLDMIQGHDPDRILFGTDTPYASQKEDAEYILRLPDLRRSEGEDSLEKRLQTARA